MTDYTEDQITAACIVKIQKLTPFIPAGVISEMAQTSQDIRSAVVDAMRLRDIVIKAVSLSPDMLGKLSEASRQQYAEYEKDIAEEKRLCGIKDKLQAKVESGKTLEEAVAEERAERGLSTPKKHGSSPIDDVLGLLDKLEAKLAEPEVSVRHVYLDDPESVAKADAELAALKDTHDIFKIVMTPEGIDSFLYELAKVHDKAHAEPTAENKAILDKFFSAARAVEDEIGEQLPNGRMSITGSKYRLTRRGDVFDFFRRREEA